jgi:hypothetical protein
VNREPYHRGGITYGRSRHCYSAPQRRSRWQVATWIAVVLSAMGWLDSLSHLRALIVPLKPGSLVAASAGGGIVLGYTADRHANGPRAYSTPGSGTQLSLEVVNWALFHGDHEPGFYWSGAGFGAIAGRQPCTYFAITIPYAFPLLCATACGLLCRRHSRDKRGGANQRGRESLLENKD